jgi:hypothetical protein
MNWGNCTGFANYSKRWKEPLYNGFEFILEKKSYFGLLRERLKIEKGELAGAGGCFVTFFVPRGTPKTEITKASKLFAHDRDMVSYGYAYIPDKNCPECKGTGINETETTYYCQTCQKSMF